MWNIQIYHFVYFVYSAIIFESKFLLENDVKGVVKNPGKKLCNVLYVFIIYHQHSLTERSGLISVPNIKYIDITHAGLKFDRQNCFANITFSEVWGNASQIPTASKSD